MDIKIETITPEMAKKYLDKNLKNRSIKQSLVSQYANEMKIGNWQLTHQGLAFSNDGHLLDGQHRLQAIIDSGLNINMVVSRGVQDDAQLVMDDHAKRTPADALTLYRDEYVSSTIVAIVRASVELQPYFRKTRVTKTEINTLLDEFKEPLAFINEFVVTKTKGVTAAPVWGAVLISWFYANDLERLHKFCRVLSGVDIPTDANDRVISVLRDWLLMNGARSSGLRIECFRKTQRAIKAYLNYERLERLVGTNSYYLYPLQNAIRLPIKI